MSAKSTDRCPYKRRKQKEPLRGEGHVKMEAKMVPKAKEYQGPPADGRGKRGSQLEPSLEVWLCWNLVLDFWLPAL